MPLLAVYKVCSPVPACKDPLLDHDAAPYCAGAAENVGKNVGHGIGPVWS